VGSAAEQHESQQLVGDVAGDGGHLGVEVWLAMRTTAAVPEG
jgi:hypothetical protein